MQTFEEIDAAEKMLNDFYYLVPELYGEVLAHIICTC